MAYNPEEIEEILRRYTSDSSTPASDSSATTSDSSVTSASSLVSDSPAASANAAKSAPDPEPIPISEPVKRDIVPDDPEEEKPVKPEPVKPEPVKQETAPKMKDKWESLDEEPSKKSPIKLKGASTKKPAKPEFEDDIPEAPKRETISDVLKPESVLRRGDIPKAAEPVASSVSSGAQSVSYEKPSEEKPRNRYDEADELDKRISRAEIMKKKSSLEAKREAEQKQKKRKKKTAVLNTLLVIFILIFLGSGSYLGFYFYKIKKAENSFDDIKKLVKEEGSKDPETGKERDNDYISYETIEGNLVQTKFSDVYTKNEDFVGWLTIPGTNVDYPVMYTPSDEQKYLHMDFYGDYSSSGTLFAAAGSNPLKGKDNTLIYGHNMKAGTMFHALLQYESESFYNEHKTIYFNTLMEDGTYEVIAAFRTQIDENDSASFKYYEFFDADDETEFNAYVDKVKSLTPYKIEESAEYGEKLLTLSTCAYHTNEGRYVVVAKKIEK